MKLFYHKISSRTIVIPVKQEARATLEVTGVLMSCIRCKWSTTFYKDLYAYIADQAQRFKLLELHVSLLQHLGLILRLSSEGLQLHRTSC